MPDDTHKPTTTTITSVSGDVEVVTTTRIRRLTSEELNAVDKEWEELQPNGRE